MLECSIHAAEAIRFAEEVIGMPQNLLTIMRDGYQPEFLADVPPYREQNNRSALDNLDFLRPKVAEWLEAGFVEELSEPAYCTSPLSVALKYDPYADKVKMRPVLDLSRHVNLFVPDLPVQLDDLTHLEHGFRIL
jgi:hypothetical protein